MVGDVANITKQDRYLATEEGRMDEAEFNQSRSEMRESQTDSIVDFLDDRVRDEHYITIDDGLVADIFLLARKNGFDSYIVPQKEGLPFSAYCEDILGNTS